MYVHLGIILMEDTIKSELYLINKKKFTIQNDSVWCTMSFMIFKKYTHIKYTRRLLHCNVGEEKYLK